MKKHKKNILIFLSIYAGIFLFVLHAMDGLALDEHPGSVKNGAPRELEPTPTKSHKELLTFGSYIGIITEQLPELKNNRLVLDRSKNAVYAASAVDDFQLDGDFQYANEDQYYGDYPDRPYGTDGYSANLSLSRTISRTGSRISTGVEYSDASSDTVQDGQRYYTPSTYIKLTQPILYNAFGLVDRFAKNDALMQLDIDEIEREENDEADMNYYKKLYFDWITYYQRLEYLKKTISNAEKLVEQTRKKFNSGLNDNDDVQEVVTSLLGYKEQRLKDEASYNAIISELAIFFNTDQYIPDVSDFDTMFSTSISYAFDNIPFNNTRNRKFYDLMKEKLVYSKKVYANKLLPELDLVGKYKFKSSRDDFTGSVKDLGDEEGYYIGLTISVPLENTERKSELQEILLDIEELNHNYDVSKNAYLKSLGEIITAMNGKRQIVDIKKAMIRSLESKYETERTKYKQGRLNLNYLVETENSIVSERINLIDLKNEAIGLYFDYVDLTN